MKQRLNFSPKPFASSPMPVYGLLLVNLALALILIGAVWYWQGLRNENRSVHDQIAKMKQKQRSVVGDHEEHIRELESIDVGKYSKQVQQFHRIQVAYQTHWGRLLDDLGLILPEDVRIVRLAPTSEARAGDRNRETVIRLSAQARNKQAQLNFIRKLQEQSAFEDIRFESESYQDGEVAVSFDIRFTHRPGKGA